MSRIRLGVIGAGGRGINTFAALFATLFKDQVEVKALADPNAERARGGLAFAGIQADIHTDARALLARRDIDAVVVTTPDYLHEEICLEAFAGKKHVLVDKPLAITGKGCLRIIEAAKRADRLLYMGFNLRHDCVVRELKRLVDAGTFGEVFSIHATEHYNGGRTYMSRWNRLKKYSGGLFIHKGSHDFDVINWLMGKPRPARVSCFGSVFSLNPEHLPFQSRPGVKPGPTCSVCPYQKECPDANILVQRDNNVLSARQWDAVAQMFGDDAARADGYHKDLCLFLSDKDTHDQGIALIEYDNGATAQHSEYFATPIDNREYIIEGTRGYGSANMAMNTIDVAPRWSKNREAHTIHRPSGNNHGGADPMMCEEFVRCIQEGVRPAASGIDGAWSVAVGEACEIARTEKRVVEISEVLDVGSDLLKIS